ncbi:MAG: hypothetical protein V2B18_19660 [Pseudomonadota bacterium]
MKHLFQSFLIGVLLCVPFSAFSETQLRNEYGQITEHRLQMDNITRVYDPNRNPYQIEIAHGNRVRVLDTGGVYNHTAGQGTLYNASGK